ncbi:hypothetical protein Lser_V15G31404 [Lactuca serriola]
MAFSLEISYMHILFLAFLTTSFPFPTKGDLIDDICTEIPDEKSLCLDTLRTDPRSPTQNLEVLAQISIDAAIKDAKGLPSLVKSLVNKVSDPEVKARVSGCVIDAQIALANLIHVKQLVDSKFYVAANENARAANDQLSVCENSFQLQPPAIEPVELTQASNLLEALVSILIIVTNHML